MTVQSCSPRCCASPEPARVASPCWSGARARFFSQLRRSAAVRYLAVARLPRSISSPPVSRFYSVLLPWCSSVISTVQGRPERHHRFVGARRRDAINDDELPLPRFHPNHRAEPHAVSSLDVASPSTVPLPRPSGRRSERRIAGPPWPPASTSRALIRPPNPLDVCARLR